MRNIILLIVTVFSVNSFSATEVMRRNIKLPSQSVLQMEKVIPVAADTDNMLGATAQAVAVTTITTFLAQPDVPRNIIITPGSTTNDIKAGNIVVSGVDSDGKAMTENIALLDNQTVASVGAKAWRRIDSVVIPVGDTPFGGTLTFGYGDTVGLGKCMDGAGFHIKGLVDGVALTGVTVSASATELGSNTFLPDPVANGTREFTNLYVQNFRCAE